LSKPGLGLQQPTSVSADGNFVLYAQRTTRGNYDLMVRRLSDNSTTAFRESPADESDARFSPDARFVAYTSDETGRDEVIVAPFPSGPGVTASIGGGRAPRWSADGRELYYISAEGELMAAGVRATGGLDVARPARLFTTRTTEGSWGDYTATPDGGFIAVVRTRIGSQQPLTVVVNWPAPVAR
jgi:dipeptidyl aminopeptidase/acylaminoacyl peptidase